MENAEGFLISSCGAKVDKLSPYLQPGTMAEALVTTLWLVSPSAKSMVKTYFYQEHY